MPPCSEPARPVISDPLGFANTTFADVYRQFKLDVGRIQLRIDAAEVPRQGVDASAVFTELLNRYATWDIGLFVAHCCTQTALAPSYVRRARQLRREAAAAERRWRRRRRQRQHDGRAVIADPGAAVEVHLLDNGCQLVEVIGTDELHIVKGFRIMRMGEGGDRPSAFAYTELSVHAHFPSNQLLVEWSDCDAVHAYSLRPPHTHAPKLKAD